MPYPSGPPQRGEIYWVDFDPARGSEQAGRRPAVVVSGNLQNAKAKTILIAAMTTTRRESPLTVIVPAVGSLREDGSILVFQLMTIDKTRLGDFLVRLNRYQIDELNAKMKVALDLP